MTTESSQLVEHLFRHRAGQITASLVRVLGFAQLDMIEDVIQDALLTALKTWPYNGIPKNPAAWITQVAKNRAIDALRRQRSWSDKQVQVLQHLDSFINENKEPDVNELTDDQLRMIFACCHPAINSDARVALTLKAVGGFSVNEIASAFLTKPATIAQRLVRAKKQIRKHQIELELPEPEDLPDRLESVLQVIYLLFNEGYSASSGNQLIRTDLCFEAIRLGGCLISYPATHPAMATPKMHALMALMYLQAARLNTRVDSAGDLILLTDQDREAWNPQMIQRGAQHLRQAATGSELSKYHLEAEISACHTLASNYAATDWQRILECYDLLYQQDPSVVIAVNRAVALLHAVDAESAQQAMDALKNNPLIANYYPYHVTRAAIAEQLGLYEQQQMWLQQAMQVAGNASIKRYLIRKLAACSATQNRSQAKA